MQARKQNFFRVTVVFAASRHAMFRNCFLVFAVLGLLLAPPSWAMMPDSKGVPSVVPEPESLQREPSQSGSFLLAAASGKKQTKPTKKQTVQSQKKSAKPAANKAPSAAYTPEISHDQEKKHFSGTVPVGISRGEASFMSNKLHGKRTASGEVYRKDRFTGAHRDLPLGTVVQVTDLNNGEKVLVRINDRGPYAKNRILDISYAAAKRLDMTGLGVTPVQIDVVSDENGRPLLPHESFYLSFGKAADQKGAQTKALEVNQAIPAAQKKVLPEAKTLHHKAGKKYEHLAVMGPFKRYVDAHAVMERLPKTLRADIIHAAPLP